MDNVLETNGVPLTVFGGAVPELAPEDLPEGASPFNQDVDFNPGSVFTRAGRANQVVYSGLSVTNLPTVAASVAGAHAPFESPWSSPGNVTLDLPSTYASAALGQGGGGGVANFVDYSVFNAANAFSNNVAAGPSAGYTDLVMFIDICDTQNGTPGSETNNAPGALSTNIPTLGATGNLTTGIAGTVPAGTAFNITSGFSASTAHLPTESSAIIALPTNGSPPVMTLIQGGGGAFGLGNHTLGGADTVPANVTLMALIYATAQSQNPPGGVSNFFDNHGNIWYLIGSCFFNGFYSGGAQYFGSGIWAYICPNPIPDVVNYSFTFTVAGGPGAIMAGTSVAVFSITNLVQIQTFNYTQVLQSSVFNFSLPANRSIVGMQVLLDGHQTNLDPSAILTANVDGQTVAFVGQLPGTDGTTAFGAPTANWNTVLTLANLNLASFKIDVVGSASSGVNVGFFIKGVKVRLWFSNISANLDWFKTYEQTNGQVDTLALDSNGILFDEQVNYGSGPGVLNSIFLNIFPNTFAKGVTFGDIEYIAFSNLINGTDIPRQWNGTNLDRISMVGPGAACLAASAGGSGGSNTTAIQSITQNAPVEIRRIAWGTVNSPNDSTPGNLLVIFGEGKTGTNTYQSLAPYTATFGAGTTVVLSGVPVPFPRKGGGTLPYNINIGPNANGSYTINQVTTGIVGGNESCPIFTIPSPTSTWAYSNDFGSAGPPPTSNWFYQSCLATVTLQAPLPNVGVGSQIQLVGTGGAPPSGYDGTWTVLQAPNASSMTINSVILSGGVATYSFTLAAGSAVPQVGQLVSTQNCLNGSGIATPNVFNVNGVAISAVSGGTFSIPLAQPDIPLQNQAGNQPPATGTVGGTIFVFDAGAIVGTKSGGTVVGTGQIGVGVRQLCYCWKTRSGFVSQPSPLSTFNVTSGSGSITVSNLSTGPPNVVARIVCFTGANGGNFFYIPQAQNVTVGGITTINSSTVINDNTSTSATFTFSDAVLLAATAIDIPGNNLFNCIELGSSRGLMTYANRMIAWSEQQKVTNLRNLSFDGGFGGVTIQGATISYPLGWQIDATSGTGGSLNFSSPIFGWAYQIQNTSGITQALYGMLTQPAYLDEFGVPIIQPATLYSVRICAQVSPAQASGNLLVDLFSPQLGVALGGFSIPLSSMTTAMAMYTGTLLTTILQPVPKDLVIRIYAQNILNGATILIDRVEPFQTLVPTNTTALKASYAGNQESFDLNTGLCGPSQNMQPINGVMELFDLLYAIKERSWFSTFDNGVTEPNQWNWKTVSNKVGTIGINSYDWGEGWALSGNREGVFFFEGGEPIKVSQEIQPLWDLINWQYGYTMWVRNDPEQRRFTVGIPIATPNPYMPEFPVNANPTSPNVVLMCNYRELNTGAALAQTGPIRSTFSGRLMSPEPARKWSFWNIACPYSDYIDRANNQWPQWFGTGYGDNKIFQTSASQLSDDGNAINSFWVSYGFVKPEMADAKGLGLFRMEFPYFTVLATGTGTLNSFVYPESPQNQPYVLDPTPLPATSQGDLEIGVNVKGQRFFIRIGTNQVGAAFRCSKMVVPLLTDPWSPIRGYNAVTA